MTHENARIIGRSALFGVLVGFTIMVLLSLALGVFGLGINIGWHVAAYLGLPETGSRFLAGAGGIIALASVAFAVIAFYEDLRVARRGY